MEIIRAIIRARPLLNKFISKEKEEDGEVTCLEDNIKRKFKGGDLRVFEGRGKGTGRKSSDI